MLVCEAALKLAPARLEGVRDVLDENETQHDVLVLGGVHVGAQLVGRGPEGALDGVDAGLCRGSLLRLLAPLPLGRRLRCGFGLGRLVLGIQTHAIRTQHRAAAPPPLAQLPRLDQCITGRHKLRLGQPGELRLELVLQGLVADAATILGNGGQQGGGKGLGV